MNENIELYDVMKNCKVGDVIQYTEICDGKVKTESAKIAFIKISEKDVRFNLVPSDLPDSATYTFFETFVTPHNDNANCKDRYGFQEIILIT